jgi:nitroreductase
MKESESVKKPKLDYPIIPLIAERWSPRAFDAKPILPSALQRIFEASRWAPSASNLQPWYFVVGIKGDEIWHKIFETLVEFNQLWVINAPILVLAIAKTSNQKGEPNKYAAYDLGQSVATLTLQARAEGIYAHQMGGFDSEKAESILNIPTDYKAMVVFTLGYLGNAEILHPNLLKLEMSPRERRPVSETVFTGSFGHKADFL